MLPIKFSHLVVYSVNLLHCRRLCIKFHFIITVVPLMLPDKGLNGVELLDEVHYECGQQMKGGHEHPKWYKSAPFKCHS
ncbi:hypothetical protein SK128_004902 [Halocaridina rubra]|uniref:Uncharacterized protein n=1 Tax=Halocaridina rubra TaxID=373956 RepID=A0AAN8WZ29_HALRR